MKLLDKKYNFLKPIKFPERNLKRFGRKADGGYVCESQLVTNTKVLITFGMGPDWTFELDCIKANPEIKIFMYDYSVSSLPYVKDIWKYFRRFITFRGKPNALIDRIKYLKNYLSFFKLKNVFFFSEKITHPIKNKIDTDVDKVFNRLDLESTIKNESVILKCDIEGSEYKIIDGIVKYSNRIEALILEFHWLDKNEQVFLDSVKQLQKYFDIAHIHGNNHCGRTKSGLPIILEITFFNKKYSPVKKEYIESFPIENLDAPNNPAEKDLAFQFYIE
jgi:hypothetical protein